jgi:hypothetical protein
MGESPGATLPVESAPEETCAECSKTLSPMDRVESGGRVFCRSCYETLRNELSRLATQMSSDVNYPMAILGAVLGGIAGVLVWWGFTVVTKIAFGLIAVAIGFLVGMGTVRFAGGKRSAGLQAVAIVTSLVSFLFATYLVNMTFINRMFAAQGETFRLGFPPPNLNLFVKVVTAGFNVMDLVFLAIVLYEAWKIPKPIRIPALPAAP